MTRFSNHQGVAVFTDGSAYTKDRTGGWAFVAIDVYGNEAEASGFVADTTISQMELYAVTQALSFVLSECGPSDVLVFSDSEYVVLGMNDKKRARKANIEYWDLLESAVASHRQEGLDGVTVFEHVKGHNKNKYNERADKLAGKARKSGKEDGSVHYKASS